MQILNSYELKSVNGGLNLQGEYQHILRPDMPFIFPAKSPMEAPTDNPNPWKNMIL